MDGSFKAPEKLIELVDRAVWGAVATVEYGGAYSGPCKANSSTFLTWHHARIPADTDGTLAVQTLDPVLVVANPMMEIAN